VFGSVKNVDKMIAKVSVYILTAVIVQPYTYGQVCSLLTSKRLKYYCDFFKTLATYLGIQIQHMWVSLCPEHFWLNVLQLLYETIHTVMQQTADIK